MDNIIQGSDGKPIFTGTDEFSPSPIRRKERSGLNCPVCGKEVDYLVGENTPDGGVQGCEGCHKPGKGSYVQEIKGQRSEETVFD